MVYDMNTEEKSGRKRLTKIMKTCRKYLTHVQKSVFEGDITEGKLALLKHEIDSIVDKDKDFVIIYSTRSRTVLTRDIITNTHDPTDNFI
ncbi:MAG: CRISPR-associated endonuclease Cas2 [Paludibacter sp.]|nr:CRISPR-associated endonuclease Cas2 [Paludibacter sp.]MDD4428970.1 CRISPR-associated endonuclease Cas2 [Paludibacter sp.]